MNIVVQSHDGRVVCRPDTSRQREDMPLYAPDFVSGYLWSPALFARVGKAGKCIGRKFTERYYDAVTYGVLLYAVSSEGLYDIMNQTTVLSFPMYDRSTLLSGRNEFRLEARRTVTEGQAEATEGPSGEFACPSVDVLYSTTAGSAAMIGDALEHVSKYASLRRGDMVAVELAEKLPLIGTGLPGELVDAAKIRLSGYFCDNQLFDFDIIM